MTSGWGLAAVCLLLAGCSATTAGTSPSPTPSVAPAPSSSSSAAVSSSTSPSSASPSSASPSSASPSSASPSVKPPRAHAPTPSASVDCNDPKLSEKEFTENCLSDRELTLPDPARFDEPYVLDSARTQVVKIVHPSAGLVEFTVRVMNLGQRRPPDLDVAPEANLSYAQGSEKLRVRSAANSISYPHPARLVGAFGDLPPIAPRASLTTTVTFEVPETHQGQVAFNFAVNPEFEWSTFVGSVR